MPEKNRDSFAKEFLLIHVTIVLFVVTGYIISKSDYYKNHAGMIEGIYVLTSFGVINFFYYETMSDLYNVLRPNLLKVSPSFVRVIGMVSLFFGIITSLVLFLSHF